VDGGIWLTQKLWRGASDLGPWVQSIKPTLHQTSAWIVWGGWRHHLRHLRPCEYPQNNHRSNSPYPHCLFTTTLLPFYGATVTSKVCYHVKMLMLKGKI